MNPYETFLRKEYPDCTILSTPIPFVELSKSKVDIDVVQLYCFDRQKFYNLGFVGAFRWHNAEVVALDSDSYTSNTLVYGYRFFTTKDYNLCVDIIVDEQHW